MYQNITSGARTAATAQDGATQSTSRFGNAANTAILAGGRAVAILGGMQVASTLYATTQNQAAVSTGQLSNALNEYAKTGKITGELQDVLGGKTDKLKDSLVALDEDGFAGFGNNLAETIEVMTGTGQVFDDSVTHYKENLSQIDQAIAQMAQSGNITGAKAAFDALAATAKENGVQLDELKAGLPLTSAALGDLSAAADQTTAAQQRLSAQQQLLNSDFNTGVTAVGGLKNAFTLLNAETQNTNTSFSAYQAALDQMTAANMNAKAGFDLTTEAGRQNYAMLQTAVTSMQNYATQANLTGPEIEALRQDIINQGVAAGISRDQMVAMTNSIGAIPGQAAPAATSVAQLESQIAALKSKQVEIKESGSADSKSRIASLQSQIDALRDKTVYLTTVLRQRTEVVGSDGLNRRFGGGYRWGGVQMYAAQSGLVANIARPGTIYQWAEPATGGEAFIPRKGDTGRSRDIAKYVVDKWLGGPEAIWGGGQPTTPGSGGSAPSGGGGASSSQDLTSLLVREIRGLGKRLENLRVDLDGQQIGRAQGRRTLLEQYGG